VLAVVAGIGIFTYRNVEVWTPLQRWYWIQYLNTKNFPSPSGDYQVLAKVDRHGQRRMTVDADVMAGAPQGRQLIPFALSQQAKQAGAVELVVDTVHYSSRQMNQILARSIFDGQSPDDLIRPAWCGALGVFVLGFGLAIPREPGSTAHAGTWPQAQGSADGYGEGIQSVEWGERHLLPDHKGKTNAFDPTLVRE